MSRFLDDAYERMVGRCLMPFYETRLRRRATFRYRDEFEANQWRPAEEIEALQWERLQKLLRHAYETVPYYREAFQTVGFQPDDIRSAADFARSPILEKATVREQGDRLISTAFNRKQLIRSATGGSTGEPMRFYYDRNSYERRVAAAMRGDGWAGWRMCGGEFYIWVVALLPESGLIRRKKQLHHASLRREIANSFDLSAERIEGMVRRYNRQRPRVVVGYANAIYEFARYVREADLKLHPPIGVISSAEKLYGYQREAIEAAFGAPVFDRYGCREVMMIGAECDRHDGLHVTVDNLYVELVANGHLCEPGERGEVLLTDLHNYGMPLIRYKVGDVASWKGRDCSCGRGLPLLNVVEGRTLDLISTPGGRVISGEFFPHLLKDFAWIRRYQIVQENIDSLVVRLMTDAPPSSEQVGLLRETMTRTLSSELRVRWEIGPEVAIETGSKFRPVLSTVPVNLEAALRD
jgi:phenylacetate-coenzyme A ligase PaaK-like adenylate-forming protein